MRTTGEAIFEALIRKVDEAADRQRRGEIQPGDAALLAMRRRLGGLIGEAVTEELGVERPAA